MTAILTYRNRTITQNDIAFIQKVIADYHVEGRTAISRRLCQAWKWQQDNGQLKDMVCRGLLLVLERKQLISLPPRIRDNNNSSLRHKTPLADIEICQQPITAICGQAEIAVIGSETRDDSPGGRAGANSGGAVYCGAGSAGVSPASLGGQDAPGSRFGLG